MAIDPPSDIVLEVAKAADPERAAAVARRLTNLAAGDGAGADFTAALDQTSPPSVATSAPVADASDMRARLANIDQAQNQKANQARVQFEAVLLNSLVGEMLPKDAPEAYGEGLAGEMWRSMLADQVSRQIARSGSLGIGQRLFATHPLTASSSLGHAERASHAGAAAAAQMSANALSAPSGADIADGAFLFRGAKPL
jgi:Rod binding domain-containing protein